MTQEKPGLVAREAAWAEGQRLGPGTCDAEVSGLVARGTAWGRADEVAELRRVVADLQGQVVALQARVYGQREKSAPEVLEKALEALQKARERDLEDMEKPVDVDPLEWEIRWLSR